MSSRDDDETREQAALYALGALSPEEARDFAARLAAGDETATAELAAFGTVTDALAYAAPPHPARPALRDAVLARIGAPTEPVVQREGLRFVFPSAMTWAAGRAKGVEVKRLVTDEAAGRNTSIVRMAPGTVYPTHRHAGIEEVYIIEGDLQVAGVTMRAGDYCRAEADSVHAGVHTVGGCVLVVTACARDDYSV